ncbi:MAG: hypothetical protein ACM3ZC_13515 [Bacteroidota bacterium]
MITVEGITADPVKVIWETDLHLIASLQIVYPGDAEVPLATGQAMPEVSFGEPGNLQKLAGYLVHRTRAKEQLVVIAHEFGGAWRDRNRALWSGPRAEALRQVLARHGERAAQIAAPGGQKLYTQHESDIAFLYRLAGNIPIWRDEQGRVNVAAPSRIEVRDIIEYAPAAAPARRYVAAGITPDGKAFEIAVGSGLTVRVTEAFHTPAEAKDHLERLHQAEARGRLVAMGQAGIRAGCTVVLSTGQEHLVIRATHEVVGAAWTVICSLA